MKYFNIMFWGSLKNVIFREVHENPIYIGGNYLKTRAKVCRFKGGGLDAKGGLIHQCTL